MKTFIESIRIESGKIHNLSYHQQRLKLTQMHHFDACTISLDEISGQLEIPTTGLYKWRITYGREIITNELIPYKRSVPQALRFVIKNDLEYNFKYEQRNVFKELKKHLPKGTEAIIIKNGYITDSTYSNLILYTQNRAFTPSSPLLKGTMRQYLIDKKVINTAEIKRDDIKNYDYIQLINALNPINISPIMPVEAVLEV